MLQEQVQRPYNKKLQVLGMILRIIKLQMRHTNHWMNAASTKGKVNHNHAAEANVKRRMVSV